MAVDLDRTHAALRVERLTKIYGDGTRALDALSVDERRHRGCVGSQPPPHGETAIGGDTS